MSEIARVSNYLEGEGLVADCSPCYAIANEWAVFAGDWLPPEQGQRPPSARADRKQRTYPPVASVARDPGFFGICLAPLASWSGVQRSAPEPGSSQRGHGESRGGFGSLDRGY